MNLKDDTERGLYGKFYVKRLDGSSEQGARHDGCEYFVLDLTHDPFAWEALRAYSNQCNARYPLLARDLRGKMDEIARRRNSGEG